MSQPLSMYLIRHGESAANLDNTVNMHLPDHEVPLSPAGPGQAHTAGLVLGRHLFDQGITDGIGVYVSPYRRAQETWTHLHAGMQIVSPAFAGLDAQKKESIFLRELEYGLFDGVPDEDLGAMFPREYAHYEKHKRYQGQFYARMPSGESRCDVAQRIQQFFSTLHTDHARHGIRHAVIVSHGVTIRAFMMQWLGLSVDWMEHAINPTNCSIRLICDATDMGLIHAGAIRIHTDTGQALRESGEIPDLTTD